MVTNFAVKFWLTWAPVRSLPCRTGTLTSAAVFLDHLSRSLDLGPSIEYASGSEYSSCCFVRDKVIVTVHSLAWRDAGSEETVEANETGKESDPSVFRLNRQPDRPPGSETCWKQEAFYREEPYNQTHPFAQAPPEVFMSFIPQACKAPQHFSTTAN